MEIRVCVCGERNKYEEFISFICKSAIKRHKFGRNTGLVRPKLNVTYEDIAHWGGQNAKVDGRPSNGLLHTP